MSQGRIPQSFIDEVLLRTDIVDLVDARVKLKRAGKNYSACCPFHQEKSPSFTVNREKQFYYCFGCGASGNALSFLMEHDRLDFIDSLKQLAGSAGLTLPETRENSTPRESHQPLFDAIEAAAAHFERQLRSAPARERAVSYLKKRGVTGAVAKAFRLGYAPPGWDNLLQAMGGDDTQRERLLQAGLLIHNEQRRSVYDAMRDRVIFPIRDFRGRVIAFGGRVLNDDKPKYLNSPESPVFHKGQELYGLYEARQSGKLTRLLVVEGYMDVVALAQFGIPEAVATLGTATSTTHVERLFRVVPEVVFCFDGDAAGRRAAWRALESALPALRDGVSARFLFLPDGEDPDSLVRREGPELFRARIDADAVPLTEQLFRTLSEGKDLNSLEGRSLLAGEAIPLLALMPDSLMRTLLVQRLGELTALATSVVDERLARLAEQALAKASASAAGPAQSTSPGTSAAPAYRPDDPPDHALAFAPDDHWHEAAAPDYPPHDEGGFGHSAYSQGSGRGHKRPWRPRGEVAPAAQRDRRPPPQMRSLSAQAVRLLLRNPAQAASWPLDMLAGLADDESDLLRQLAASLQQEPGLSMATLLGRWHGTAIGDQLGALAASEWLVELSDSSAEAEASALLLRLQLQALDREMAILNQQLQQAPEPALLRAIGELKKRQAALRQQTGTTAG